MALLNWSRKRYTVGVAALDDQHTVFIGSLNKLHAAMIQGKGRDITGPLLHALTSSTHEHFSAEEALMASTGFSGLAEHRAEHQGFDAKLEELNVQYEQGDDEVCIPLLKLMRDWISTHILEEDRKYMPWLNEHDVH
jgi:hemerythrin